MFPSNEQKLVYDWTNKPSKYKERTEVTNVMKKYIVHKEKIKDFEETFHKLSDHSISKFGSDNCIINAEKCLNNCLKFGDDGHLAILLFSFFLDKTLIGKFWSYIFCGIQLKLNSGNNPNPNLSSNQNLPSPNSNMKQPQKIDPSLNQFPPNFQSFNQNPLQFQPTGQLLPYPPFNYQNSQLNYNYQNSHFNDNYQNSQTHSFQNSQFLPNQPFNYQNSQFYSSQTHQLLPSSQPHESVSKVENTDMYIDSLCKVFDTELNFDSSPDSREFINYFWTRFLKYGLEKSCQSFNFSHLEKIFGKVNEYIFSILECECPICQESFQMCCESYGYIVKTLLESNSVRDQFRYLIIESIVSLLDKTHTSLNQFFNVMANIIKDVNITKFQKRIKKVLKIVLKVGLRLTDEFIVNPILMEQCLNTVNSIFNEKSLYGFIEDSKLITRSVRFFYLNRFYAPFRGIVQRIASSDLKSKIDLDEIYDIVLSAFSEEEEENHIEYKEYIKLFNEIIENKSKLVKEPLFDAKLVMDDLSLLLNKANQKNLEDIEEIRPIADACRESFIELYKRNIGEQAEEEENELNLFL